MKGGAEIWLDGERELFINLQRHLGDVNTSARSALHKGAMQIVNDAKQNLRDGGNIVTGQLRASGKVQKVEGDEDSVDSGFFSQNTSGGYAFYVEYGRRAGKFPPVDMIAQWVRKKFRVNDIKEAKGIGFVIARKIAKKGTKPHPFFNPAIEKNKDAVTRAIEAAVKKEL